MDRIRKEFKIDDIFDIYTGATIRQNELWIWDIPRITATDTKNGVGLFTSRLNHKNYRVLENCITISFLGSVFYQKNQVSLDIKIHAVKIKEKELNNYIALFLIPFLKSFALKYSYWYQLSTSVLKSQKLLLPVTKLEQPDWNFMENYIKNREEKILKKTIPYFENKPQKLIEGGGKHLKR